MNLVKNLAIFVLFILFVCALSSSVIYAVSGYYWWEPLKEDFGRALALITIHVLCLVFPIPAILAIKEGE